MQKYANVEQTFSFFTVHLLNHFFLCLNEFLSNFTNCCHETWISSGGHSIKGSGCSSIPSSHLEIFRSSTPSFVVNVGVFLPSEWHFHYMLLESVWRSYFHCCLAKQAFCWSTSSEEVTSGVQWELLPHWEQFRASCTKVRQRLRAPMAGRCSINGLACMLWDRNILLSWVPIIFC